MKARFIAFVLLSITLSLHAQDKIVTQEGEVIVGYGTEVGSSSVFYRLSSDENSSMKKIPKDSVLMMCL